MEQPDSPEPLKALLHFPFDPETTSWSEPGELARLPYSVCAGYLTVSPPASLPAPPASANVAAMIGEAPLVPPMVTQPDRSVLPSLTGVESYTATPV